MSDLNQQKEEWNPTVSTEEGAGASAHERHTLFGAERSPSDATRIKKNEPRPFKPQQFLFGLALSAGGMVLMLFVAAGALHDVGGGGAVSLPATGLCMILGLMLLGGGFGQMAISSPSFDDTEFQRLLNGETKDDDNDDSGNRDEAGKANRGNQEQLTEAHRDEQLMSDKDVWDNDSQTDARPATADRDVGVQSSVNVSESKKRLQTETSDNLVSTVLSDVAASQG